MVMAWTLLHDNGRLGNLLYFTGLITNSRMVIDLEAKAWTMDGRPGMIMDPSAPRVMIMDLH